jgi:hypothetical protein
LTDFLIISRHFTGRPRSKGDGAAWGFAPSIATTPSAVAPAGAARRSIGHGRHEWVTGSNCA